MHIVDWGIVGMVVGLFLLIAYTGKRYTRDVASYLAANRCAGRYLLTIGEGAAGLGLITIIGMWEMYYNAGFGALWWSKMLSPIGTVLALSGWVIYRFRQTRALTIAQFFEIRYTRRFRIMCGILIWLSGILNYGIFPAVTANALIYLTGMPVVMVSVGPLALNMTMGIVMAVLLGLAMALIFMGGQITVMICDFIQGQFFAIVFLVIAAFLVLNYPFTTLLETMAEHTVGKSMVNPFDQQELRGFSVGYFLMTGFLWVIGYRAWQGSQAYNCSATSPHEARMAGILAGWRTQVILLLTVICPVVIFTILHSPLYADTAVQLSGILDQIPDAQVRTQMTVPVGLKLLLPVGLMGLLAATFVATAVSTDDTYLHSWGSIFIQDVVMPFRKKPLSAKQHLRWLKSSVLGTAIFAWIWSMLFPLKEFVMMYFQLTASIYLGGAGAVIIGGLYWKRGTSAGAYACMIFGSAASVLSLVIKNILWEYVPVLQASMADTSWVQRLPEVFPLTGNQISFFVAVSSVLIYVVVSCLTRVDPSFDMDRMLHRGQYAVDADQPTVARNISPILRAFGITREFTVGDKVIYFLSIFNVFFWFFSFVIGTVFFRGVSTESWFKWWRFELGVIGIMAGVTTIWFIIGGARDMRDFFARLKTIKTSNRDDGTVLGHRNADELEDMGTVSPTQSRQAGS